MNSNNPWALASGLEDDASIVEQVQVNISETHDEDGVPLEYEDPETGEAISEPIEAEALEAELEVQEAEDVVEKLQETGEDLESHLIGIEARERSEGGLTSNEVHTMMVGLKRTFPNIGAIHPGNESFNNNRLAASNEVKERLMTGLSELWKKLKAIIERVRAKMTQWFAKLLGKASRTKRKAQAVRKKASNTRGAPLDDTVEISGIGDKITAENGSVPKSGQAVKSQLDELQKAVVWAYGPVAAQSKAVTKALKNDFKSLIDSMSKEAAKSTSTSMADNAAFINSLLNASEINKAAKGLSGKTYNIGRDARFTGLVAPVYVTLPGNEAIFFLQGANSFSGTASSSVADEITLEKHFANMGPKLMKYDNTSTKPVEAKQDYATLPAAMVVNICDVIIAILSKIVEHEANYRDVVNLNKSLQSEIDAAVAKAERDKNLKANASYMAVTSKIIRGGGSMMQAQVKFYPAFTKYILNLVNAYMLWCTKSLSNHGTE